MAAAHQAIKGALAVGTDYVLKGNAFFGAEVAVTDGDKRERFVVVVGLTPLNGRG